MVHAWFMRFILLYLSRWGSQVGRGEGQTEDLLHVASLLAGGGPQSKLVICYTICVVCTSTCYTKFVFGTRIYSSDEFRDSSRYEIDIAIVDADADSVESVYHTYCVLPRVTDRETRTDGFEITSV